MICCELTACANDTDQAEDKGEDPAGTAVEAVAATDDDCHSKGGKVNDEFENGNTASRVELHFEDVEYGVC